MNRQLLCIPLTLVAMLACSCSSEDDVKRATLDGLDYAVPVGWSSQDLSEHQRKIIVWTPSDNARKESVTIMRTNALAAMTKADPSRLERLLDQAQGKLPQGKFGRATRFKTKRGFVGVRLEGEFVPAGAAVSYRRMHALVIDGTSLVHVLYTARVVDREAFDVVLDSLYRKAA